MDRRNFLKSTAALGVVVAASSGPDFWRAALAAPAVSGPGPYGALQPINSHGLQLPAGFSSRIVAVTGVVAAGPLGGRSAYPWHGAPDGAATFPTADGGWILVSNSELGFPNGGAGALRFDSSGTVADSYPVLKGTGGNCAGGPTPWGTWISCEERGTAGTLWECDPLVPVVAANPAQRREAFGFRNHEAIAFDQINRRAFVTEDASTGRFYRFTPTNPDLPSGAWNLSAGTLEAAFRNNDDASGRTGTFTWVPVTNITTGYRGLDSSAFAGGEGCWYDDGFVFFACKGDDSVWSLETATNKFELIHRPDISTGSTLAGGTDNVFVSPYSGDVFVAEDGPNEPEICIITPPDASGNRTVSPFVKMFNSTDSEWAGPCFSPDGTRMYASSQRGYNSNAPAGTPLNQGVTYEISGPFRVTRDLEVPMGSGAGLAMPGVVGVAGVALAAAAGATMLNRRKALVAAETAGDTPADIG